MKLAPGLIPIFAAALLHSEGAALAPSWDLPPELQTTGGFWREHWYERGLTNGNPAYERRFRINSPEASLHPSFGRRAEARENGLMLIKTEEDLFQAAGAELYVELWGGHPGTANKRVGINGRSVYPLPRTGAEEGQCTYTYPVIPLRLDDLVNGYNAFQWALDQGTTFWGHALIDEACLRVALTDGHSYLRDSGLAGFAPAVSVSDDSRLSLAGAGPLASRISQVAFQAWYSGYDENGNLRERDWHGFTKNRQPIGYAALVDQPPFIAEWDRSMIPAQNNVAIRAVVRFKDAPGLVYLTRATTGLHIEHASGVEVALVRADHSSVPFWSRAGEKRRGQFLLNIEPASIERAELIVRTWTGGAGTIKDYFTLNGRFFPVAEGANHVVQFGRFSVEPALLKKGTNLMELLSDTEHHGIEVCSPGPALIVRFRR